METTAADISSKSLSVVKSTDPLAVAYKLMVEKKIRHLPVVDDAGEMIGILSNRDILRAADSVISYEYGFIFENLSLRDNLLVEDYMTSPVQSLPSDTPLKLVAEKMLEQKISCFLISNKEDTVGIVTTDDLLQYLVYLLDQSSDHWLVNLKTLSSGPFKHFATNF